MDDPTTDPAAELGAAQRRIRRRMLVRLAIAAVGLGVAITALALCSGGGPPRPPIARPYLWLVTGDGEPSFLFGTMHIGYGVADLPAIVLDAQTWADTTVLESDLLGARDPAPQAGHAGRDRLTAREWAQLAELTGLDPATLEAATTSRLLGAALASLTPKVEPMDSGLQTRATLLGKQLAFLETRELEAVMDQGIILEGVRAIAAHPGAFRAELWRLIRRYASGSEEGWGSSVSELFPVEQLNRDWADGIEAQVRRGGAFIAVGCSHLVGVGSIVAELRDRGYQVRRAVRADVP